MKKINDNARKTRRKAWLYGAALLLLCAFLTANGPARVAPAPSGAVPAAAQTEAMNVEATLYRGGLFNMLLCVADYDALGTITLVSVTERGEVQLLAIPKDTRIRTPAGHMTGEAFTRLSDLFALGDGALESALYMRTAVSALLGGIPVDHCVILDEASIARVIDAMGGILLDSGRYGEYRRQVSAEDEAEAAYAGEDGLALNGQAFSEQDAAEDGAPQETTYPDDGGWVYLAGEEAMAFALHSLLSDAQGALLPYTTDLTLISNMAHTVDRLIERMREYGPNKTVPLLMDAATCSTLDEEARLSLITRFNKPIVRDASPSLLIGEEYKQDFYCWLPDMPALKKWVLDTCYEVR